MSTLKTLYGSNGQAITITLAGLGNGSSRESTAVDNSSNLYLDVLVELKIKTGGSGTSTAGYLNVYAYGTANGGTNYTDGATGSDAAFTPTSPTNLKLIGVINAVANATTYIGGPFSLAAAFGGVLPDHWGIVVQNNTGGTLDSTGGNFSVFYQGIQLQSV